MPAVQLYAKQQGTETYVALDLNESEPIKLNLSVANIIDPTATNSVFSRTFRVPHTSINGPYFKGVFNVNSMDFDAAAKADAYILDNGIFFENGNIRLNAIYTNSEDNSVEYEITFYGATSDFGSKIGGGFLNEVNLNKFNHSKNYQNITASWTGGLFNYDVVYGLIEWGYTYNDKNQPSVPTLSANFSPSAGSPPSAKGSFTYPLYPYLLQQWKPQIRAKALWDQIFEEAGYTYDSTFLDSDFFKKQYIISDNQARATLDNANTFKADNQGVTYQVLQAQFQWITPVEIEDPGSNFVPSQSASGIYTAPASGNYTFKMTASEVDVYLYGAGADDAIIGWEAKVVDVDTAQVVGLDVGQWTFTQYGNTESLNAEMFTNLNANQKVRFEFRTFKISGPVAQYGTSIQFFNTAVECSNAPNIMSFNAIMPSNIRKIDFMKSIINKYRLVFIPSKFEANHFTITPWKDWILEGNSKDWTNKLDASKDMVIKPLFFDQARFQIYKDQEDSDYLNYNYQLGIKQTFGQLNLDSTNELIKGTKEYKDQFAPTPLDGIGWRGINSGGWTSEEAAQFVIPHIAKDTGGNADVADAVAVGKREPIQPKLRLVFYNGLRATPNSKEWYMVDNNGDPNGMTSYPLMSQYSEFPVTSTTYDLNWENDLPLWDIPVNGKAQTPFSCFNVFWKTWYDVTFDPYSRLVEANFVLDYNDILDLKFNDYIFVKDAWYFVNSISDYVTGTVSNCRVQLIKLGNNVGVTLPVVSPPTYASTETCYHPTVKCTAACCATYDGSQNVTIYIDGLTLVTSTIAYQDQYGGIIAAPGYYKDASGTVYVNGNGAIAVQTTNDCNCVPVYYSFTAYLNTSGCEVCCNNGPTVTVYGSNPTFELNSHFYQNTLLTLPAPAGFYKQAGATFALQVIPNGSVVNSFICDNCNCTTYYPFTVCKSSSLCDACCCPNGTITVYGTNANFGNNTKLYLDNAGGQVAPQSWYKFNNTTVAQVTGMAGDITSFGTCSGCPTCPIGPVDITVNVSAQKAGYTTSTIVQKSYDSGVNWVDVGTVTIETSDPADTQKTQVFNCENGVRLRAINSTNTVNGNMQTNYYIDLNVFEDSVALTPTTVTLTIPSSVSEDFVYEFNNIVTGGDVLDTDKIVVGGIFDKYQGAGWPSSGGSSMGSLLALDTTDANVNLTYNTNIGATANPLSTGLSVIDTDGTNLYFVPPINSISDRKIFYNNTQLTKSVCKLNADGSINTTFNSNWPDAFQSATPRIFVVNNKLFVASNTNIKSAALDGTIDAGWTVPTINSTISKIIFYNNLYYVLGGFTTVNAVTRNRIVVLNLDGSVNTTESNKFNTGFNNTILDAYLYNTTLVAAGIFTTYKGVSANRLIAIDITTGNVASGFTIGTGSSVAVTNVLADSTGIYVNKQNIAGTYKGVSVSNIYKIDYSGNILAGFVPVFGIVTYQTSIQPLTARMVFDTDGDLLVMGRFNRVNSNVYGGLVKINKNDGTDIATFATGVGFTQVVPDSYLQTPPSVTNLVIANNNYYPVGNYTKYKDIEKYSIVGIDQTANILSGFNSGEGLKIGYSLNALEYAVVRGIQKDSLNNTYVRITGNGNDTGTPCFYKGVKLNTDVAKINTSGQLDTTFNNNINTIFATQLLKVFDDKIYRYGVTTTPAGVTSNIMVRLNLDGTVDNTFSFNGTTSIVALNDMLLYNNLLYLTGHLSGTQSCIMVLNLDGTINTTETAKFNRFLTSILVIGQSIKIYNNILYGIYSQGNYEIDYDGVQMSNIFAANLSDGTAVSGFTPGGGFRTYTPLPTPSYSNGSIYSFDVDSTGIYVGNRNGTYKGVACSKIAKLDFSANLVNTFDIGTFSTTSDLAITKLGIVGDYLYVVGDFTTVNGTTSKGLIKLNKADGSIDTVFDVNTGFTYDTTTDSTLNYDFALLPGLGITTYPIGVSFSDENPCAAYCNTPYSTTIYGNGLSLAQSTILYSNQFGTIYAPAGWYSDGGSIAQVDGNGVIIGYTNINTCNCNTLYQFEVGYDLDTCISCGVTGAPALETVFGANSNWSSNNILYYDAAGTLPVAQGWYTYNYGIALYVASNGYVQNGIICNSVCGPIADCVEQHILNTSGYQINWSYYNCTLGIIQSGTLNNGVTLITPCIQPGSFNASGNYSILDEYQC